MREAGRGKILQSLEVWLGQLICAKKMECFFLELNNNVLPLTNNSDKGTERQKYTSSLHLFSLRLVLSVRVER